MTRVYKNSTEVAQVHGVPMYMEDILDACLIGRLNLFLQGDTGCGKTQLAADAMQYFGSGVGDGEMAREVLEKYASALDSKGTIAASLAQRFPEDKSLFVL